VDVANPTVAGDDGIAEAARPVDTGRRARTEKLILAATREMLAEFGVNGLTVEGVASRSGVAKTTIYRRYRSKTDLALAVLLDSVEYLGTTPDVGDTYAELAAVVDRTIELLSSTLIGRIMQGLVSEVAADPELARAYRERVVNRRVADVRRLVERGISRGDLSPDVDAEMLTDLLLGPIYYRFFLSGSPLDEGFGVRLVSTLFSRGPAQGA
jgi:AcrR family transcriptional regulator